MKAILLQKKIFDNWLKITAMEQETIEQKSIIFLSYLTFQKIAENDLFSFVRFSR